MVRLAEGRTTESAENNHDLKHEVPRVEATDHKPIVMIAVEYKAVEQTINGTNLGSNMIRESESKAIVREVYTGEKMASDRPERNVATEKDANQKAVREGGTTCTTHEEAPRKVDVSKEDETVHKV